MLQPEIKHFKQRRGFFHCNSPIKLIVKKDVKGAVYLYAGEVWPVTFVPEVD